MPLKIVRNDITTMAVDAIVTSSNERLLAGSGVNGAIHRAAGPKLQDACKKLGGCKTGSAKITRGYNLSAKYVIHTVGPVWHGGEVGEKNLLASCYRECLVLAQKHGCESVAFPLISAGVFGYPKDQAIRVAMDTITGFLAQCEMTVYLVIFDRAAFAISSQLFSDIAAYIDDRYVDLHRDTYAVRRICEGVLEPTVLQAPCATQPLSLDDALKQLDESFAQMLLRKIDEKGMKDADCYKKANIDRKLFHKIHSVPGYKPSKPTVLAFAIALELNLEQTKEMLQKAGFALSHSNKFDIIVEYFILQGNYNIFEINEALFAFDQSLLGG